MGPLFKNIIPDYKFTSASSCGRNKTTAILDEANSSHRHNFIESTAGRILLVPVQMVQTILELAK